MLTDSLSCLEGFLETSLALFNGRAECKFITQSSWTVLRPAHGLTRRVGASLGRDRPWFESG
jgi:hypothetical protein